MDNDVLISLFAKITYTAGIVASFWKLVDKTFNHISKRHEENISRISGDKIKEELRPLKEAIEEIKRTREADIQFQHVQFREILTELRKED